MDYRKDPSVTMSQNDQVSVIDGKKIIKHFTKGWDLCCKWKDNSTSWQKLSELKESYPLQVAEFMFAVKLLMNRHLTGGRVGSTRRGIGLSFRLSTKSLDTTHRFISLGLNSLRLLRRLTPLIVRQVLPSGVMRLKRR
jgi:hypothetical protein